MCARSCFFGRMPRCRACLPPTGGASSRLRACEARRGRRTMASAQRATARGPTGRATASTALCSFQPGIALTWLCKRTLLCAVLPASVAHFLWSARAPSMERSVRQQAALLFQNEYAHHPRASDFKKASEDLRFPFWPAEQVGWLPLFNQHEVQVVPSCLLHSPCVQHVCTCNWCAAR